MAKKRRKSHKGKRKAHKKAKGHIPLEVLEKRLHKLNKVVEKRGGETPYD